MLKSLHVAAGFVLATAGLMACGATDQPVLDTSKMGDGTDNKTALGGFWWTYVDRTLKSEVTPNTGKIEPTNAKATQLRSGFSLGAGQGIEMDGSHPAFHVVGKVMPEPSDLQEDPDLKKLQPDPYWSDLYADLCAGGDCGEKKYPSAGAGFGFKAKNAVLGEDAKDRYGRLTKGIGFRMRLGDTHAKKGNDFRPVSVSAPMDLTDAPDPSFGDQYGTAYAELGLTSFLYPNKPLANYPICSFPNTLKPDGASTYSNDSKTCFCNLTKTISATAEWQTFCVAWDEFRSPAWGGLTSASVPNGGITGIIPERLIKFQFDAYKPTRTEEAASFDFWIDDVRLLGQDDWDAYCASKRI